MTAYKGANMTKWDAGGSGDNIIPDGYIKTVEKVWMDEFAFTAVLTTADTVAIATIPPNKKITDCIVSFPAITPTTCTILVGTATDDDLIIDDHPTNMPVGSAATQTDVEVVRMDNAIGHLATTTSTTNTVIYLKIGTIAMTAPTAGTIRTCVKYT